MTQPLPVPLLSKKLDLKKGPGLVTMPSSQWDPSQPSDRIGILLAGGILTFPMNIPKKPSSFFT